MHHSIRSKAIIATITLYCVYILSLVDSGLEVVIDTVHHFNNLPKRKLCEFLLADLWSDLYNTHTNIHNNSINFMRI